MVHTIMSQAHMLCSASCHLYYIVHGNGKQAQCMTIHACKHAAVVSNNNAVKLCITVNKRSGPRGYPPTSPHVLKLTMRSYKSSSWRTHLWYAVRIHPQAYSDTSTVSISHCPHRHVFRALQMSPAAGALP
jgi:hypothetical protein